jgi:hypothetical protein
LARCAQLEAASIDAFEILAAELEAFGAPRRLVLAASRAARDEVRHAKTMTALAGTGVVAEQRRSRRGGRRSLRAVAIENAIEGCVRETYGALVAMWQGQTAADAQLRGALRRIGRDEAQHAQLAWEVHRWAHPRLSREARRDVERARANAIRELRAELRRSPPAALAGALGLPSAPQALILLDRLVEEMAA